MPDSKTISRQYYPYMDGFRAIAVYWVMLHHMFYFFGIQKAFGQVYAFVLVFCSVDIKGILMPIQGIVKNVASCGNLGVDMFFVISGFLITGLLTERLDGPVDIKRFYLRRFFKIMPQYVFAVSVVVFFYLTSKPFMITEGMFPQPSHAWGSVWWSYYLFLQNYVPQIPMLSHTWSLVIEEHFYLFYPIMIGLICSVVNDAVSRRRLIILICVGIVAVCNCIRYFYFSSGIPELNTYLPSPHHFQTTLFRVDALAVGCLLKLFEDRLKETGKFWNVLTPVIFVSGVSIYLLFLFNKLSVGGYASDRWYTYTLAYLAPALLFIAAYRGFPLVKGLVEIPFLRTIGRNSYGIYLWHYILIYPAALLVPQYGTISAVIIYFVGVTMVGVITTVTIEKYFLALRAKIAP